MSTLGRWFRTLPLVLLIAPLGCTDDAPAEAVFSGQYPYQAVCTTAMIADAVEHVAGDKAQVTFIISSDPHVYKPTRDDVQALDQANIVFYNGLGLEGQMGETLAQLGESGKPVVAVAEALPSSYLRNPPEFEGHPDPHVWMDVEAWQQCVSEVAEELARFDPPSAEQYRKNAADYNAELAKLHVYVEQVIASVPEEHRLLVTAHDAFGYFSREYNIPVESVIGLTTTNEPSVEDRNRLERILVDKGVKAVFIESSVSEKYIKAVIAGAQDKRPGHEIRIGGSLFSDAMGAPGTYEGSYVGMIDHNATTIARALGGEAPAKGMNGRLSGE